MSKKQHHTIVPRNAYLQELLAWQDKQIIKVITGVRRSGKSVLLELYQAELLKQGVDPQQIITLNLEDLDLPEFAGSRELYVYVKKRLLPDKKNYVFIDEVQKVPDFQEAIDSLYIRSEIDLYITGSNANLLSGELATLLSGRYVKIDILPLSFSEYRLAFDTSLSNADIYREYLRLGSFPYVLQLQHDDMLVRRYLESMLDTVLLKDVAARHRVADVEQLLLLTRFMFDNVGNLCSIKGISDAMSGAGNKISPHTVQAYVTALTESYLFYPTKRFDIKGKRYLKSTEKYYAVDTGLRYALLGNRNQDLGRMLENIVFLELLRQARPVYVGVLDGKEIDFVIEGKSGFDYIQVALSVREDTTRKRELAPLEKVRNYQSRLLLTLDNDPEISHDGIVQRNVLDWLLESTVGAVT